MSELTTQLPERLNNTEETGLDAVLSIPLLRLIVERHMSALHWQSWEACHF